MSRPTTGTLPVPVSVSNETAMLRHVIVDREGEDIVVCTMFPQRLEDGDVETQWLGAEGESFVSLERMR
ncbi:hypothetical protein [Natrialba sp. INN-245]|uniref:DUF7511 domain-containing protein n=1 Tax=Natrialba sp. INN-245 TaxID=2690967 RepID=UPI0013124FCB|nr:hypothetical protein [Natrialba sp. INN-245]MWV39643.1 hypothetical protein [Natrialba sp. INN-245]